MCLSQTAPLFTWESATEKFEGPEQRTRREQAAVKATEEVDRKQVCLDRVSTCVCGRDATCGQCFHQNSSRKMLCVCPPSMWFPNIGMRLNTSNGVVESTSQLQLI